jgi:thiamine pyrophosphokinase
VDEASEPQIVVISGAAPLPPHVVEAIPPSGWIIAADGGLDVARQAGLRPNLLVGDLDSISDAGLAWAEEHVEIDRHPTDKDLTDTELALARAAAARPQRVTMIGGGDRLDHTLAAIGALAAPRLRDVPRVDGWWDGQHLEVLHGPTARRLPVVVGSTVSLVALGGGSVGVRVSGTRWTLDGIDLAPMAGLGVSNVATSSTVTVTVDGGVLVVFDQPAPVPAPSDGDSPRTEEVPS